MKNKNLKIIFRLAIAVVLIYFLFQKIDIQPILQNIAKTNINWLLFGFLVAIFAVATSSFRWIFLLRNQGVSLSFWRAFQIYYIGIFFNMFLLGSIGGDAMRGVYLYKETGKKLDTTTSILVERIMGVVSLIFISLFFYLFKFSFFRNTAIEPILWILYSLFFLVVIFYLISQKFNFLKLFLERVLGKRFITIEQVLNSFASTGSNKKLFLLAFLFSVVFNFLNILIMICVAKSLGIYIPAFLFFVVHPIIILLMFLPISFNGIGVREWAGITFYPLVGILTVDILTVQITQFILVIFNSLFGGLIFLFYKTKKLKN